MKQEVSVFWFRRDLRLNDNTALYHALCSDKPVLPIFIFDPEILGKIPDKNDKRLSFIHRIICKIDANLHKHGSALHVFYGQVTEIFQNILSEFNVKDVFLNHDYEPYGIKRDLIT